MANANNLNDVLRALSLPVDLGPARTAVQILGILSCASITVFVLYTTAFGQLPGPAQYAVVLTLGMTAIFSLKPGPLARVSAAGDMALSVLLILLTAGSGIYYLNQYQEIASLREGIPNTADLVCYVSGTLCVLEGARRVEGWILVGVVLAAIVYMDILHNKRSREFRVFFGHCGSFAQNNAALAG